MGRIVAFHGADHKCGTSMLCQCCAEYYASAHRDRRVLLLHAEASAGSDYCKGAGELLEDIRPYMASQIIDAEDIVVKSHWRDNLYVIGGHRTPDYASDYLPDMAQLLLSVLKNHFDLIFCDSGSEIENGMSMGALFAADEICGVLSQRESALRRFEWMSSLYRRLDILPGRFAVNFWTAQNVYELGYLSKRLGLPREVLYKVALHSAGDSAEFLGRSLWELKPARAFRRDVKRLCEALCGESPAEEGQRGAANA